MRQVVQNYRTGELRLEEVPEPQPARGGVRVRNRFSLVSAGTERAKVELARSSLWEKARQRPDQVRQVLDSLRQEGVLATLEKVWTRLDTPVTLGYSCAGLVEAVGPGASGFSVGQRVACAGEGFACHAEVVAVPGGLCAPVPEGVPLEAAAFAGVGAIALQGVRQAGVALGERVAVIGLGLVGLLATQLLRAAGCAVLGLDVDGRKTEMARALGADAVSAGQGAIALAAGEAFSGGAGCDAILVTAASTSREILRLAGQLCRERGTVVVVGAVPLAVPRKEYYEKELTLRLSRAFGPGTYDPLVTRRGEEYPIGYVRWTAGRNMEAFLEQVRAGRVIVTPLITHRFPIAEAPRAYELLRQGDALTVGVLFDYGAGPGEPAPIRHAPAAPHGVVAPAPEPAGVVRVGVVGAGRFAQATLLPALRRLPGVALRGVATATGTTAAHAARKFGFAFATSDAGEVVEDPEADGIVIATRHGLHAELAARALRAGKTVFVEKPLAITLSELRAVAEAEAAHPGRLMVGFNRRFAPLARRLRAFLAEQPGPWCLQCRVNAGSLPSEHWVHDPLEGGGPIRGEAGHFLDLFQFLVGARPVQVYAAAPANTPAGSVQATVSYADGSVATLLYATLGDRAFGRERLEVFGARAVAALENFRRLILVRDGRRRVLFRLRRDLGHQEEMATWLEVVRGKRAVPVPFADLATVTLATFAILESLERRAPVRVRDPEDLLTEREG